MTVHTTTSERATVLTPEDHEHFIKYGFIVLKDAIPPEVVVAARQTLEAGSADYQSIGSPAVKACISERVHQALTELFGPEYSFHHHRDIVSMPRPLTPEEADEAASPDDPVAQGGAHLDEDKPSIMPHTWALESWVFLTKVNHRGGAFMFSAGSPNLVRAILIRGHRAPINGWFTESLLETSAGDIPIEIPIPLKEFLAEPGDVLIYQHLMAHCGSTNVADPTTRQAILARFAPARRIVPGDKPFEAMSTVEKINSASYLKHRFGSEMFQLPTVADDQTTAHALRAGFAPASRLICQAPFRFGGRAHIFYVEEDAPDQVRRVSTSDWVEWTPEAQIAMPGPISDVVIYHHFPGIMLCATVEVAPGQLRPLIWRSDDMTSWEPLAEPQVAARYAHPLYLTLAESRQAQGNMVFFVDPAAPKELQWIVGEDTYGNDWEEAESWRWRGIGARYRGAGMLARFTIEPLVGELSHAVVIAAEGDDQATLYYGVSEDSADFGALQPLACAQGRPHTVRVYDRAYKYWLVSYIDSAGERPTVRWGYIDWDASPVVLTPIDAPEALRTAFCTVGLL
jgi:hypothetical protein